MTFLDLSFDGSYSALIVLNESIFLFLWIGLYNIKLILFLF